MLSIFSKKDIKISSLGSITIKFGATFLGLLNSVLLARILSVEGLGVYVLVFSTITILSIPTTLGLPSLLIRYVSKYELNQDYALMKGILIRSNAYTIIITSVIYLVCFILYLLWFNSFEGEVIKAFLYGLILIPLLSLASLRSAALKGLRYVILADIPESLLKNLLFSILLVVFWFSPYQLTPSFAILLNVIAASIAFIVGYLFLRQKMLKKIRYVKPKFNNKKWFNESISFSINSSVTILRTRIIIYVLAIFGNVESVAIFDIASKGANLVSFALNAINSAISPYISKLYEEKNFVRLQKVLQISARFIFFSSLVITLIFVIGGKSLLAFIFGKEYSSSFIPLLILSAGQLISSLIGSVGLLLNMTGRQRIFSKSNLWTLLLSTAFSIPFVIYFDVIGVAFMFSFFLIVQNIILYIFVRRDLGFNTTIF